MLQGSLSHVLLSSVPKDCFVGCHPPAGMHVFKTLPCNSPALPISHKNKSSDCFVCCRIVQPHQASNPRLLNVTVLLPLAVAHAALWCWRTVPIMLARQWEHCVTCPCLGHTQLYEEELQGNADVVLAHLFWAEICLQAEAGPHLAGRLSPDVVCHGISAQAQQPRDIQIVCCHHQMVQLICAHLCRSRGLSVSHIYPRLDMEWDSAMLWSTRMTGRYR